MHFHIVKMYKDKEVNKNVKNIFFINVWRKIVFDICFTGFGTALTTILPIFFQYCYKYCYIDSRNLWDVMLFLLNFEWKRILFPLFSGKVQRSILFHLIDKVLISYFRRLLRDVVDRVINVSDTSTHMPLHLWR